MNHYTITLGTLDRLSDTLSDYQNEVMVDQKARRDAVSDAVAQAIKLVLDKVDTTEIDIADGKESLYLYGVDLNDDMPCKLVVGRIIAHDYYSSTDKRIDEVRLTYPENFTEVMTRIAELLPVALKQRYPEGNVTCSGVEMRSPAGDRSLWHMKILLQLPPSAQRTVVAAIAAVQPKKVAKIETPPKARKRQPTKTPKSAKRRSKKAARA